MVRHPHPLVSPSLPAVALKRLHRTRFHHQAPIWASKAFVLRQFAEIPSPASRNVEISSSFDVLRSSGASGRDQNEFMNVHAPSTTPGDGVLRLQLPHVKEPFHAHVQLCLGLCGLPRHHPAGRGALQVHERLGSVGLHLRRADPHRLLDLPPKDARCGLEASAAGLLRRHLPPHHPHGHALQSRAPAPAVEDRGHLYCGPRRARGPVLVRRSALHGPHARHRRHPAARGRHRGHHDDAEGRA